MGPRIIHLALIAALSGDSPDRAVFLSPHDVRAWQDRGRVGFLAMGVGTISCRGGAYTVTAVDPQGIRLAEVDRPHRHAWLRPQGGLTGCAQIAPAAFATLAQVLTPGDAGYVDTEDVGESTP